VWSVEHEFRVFLDGEDARQGENVRGSKNLEKMTDFGQIRVSSNTR